MIKKPILLSAVAFLLTFLSINSTNAQIACEGLGRDEWGCINSLCSDGCVYTICGETQQSARSCGAEEDAG